MKIASSALALAATLAVSGVASAQTAVPSGGPDAKANAPLKHAHTVNDGTARRGANSFTEGQARTHIQHSGYSNVSPLTKGRDGVWRGTATRGGATVNVGLDYKGNVSEGGPAAGMGGVASEGATAPGGPDMAGPTRTVATAGETSGSASLAHHRRHWRHHHGRRHAAGRCADPTPNGAACSGVDRNGNGISDKEDHAINRGAHP